MKRPDRGTAARERSAALFPAVPFGGLAAASELQFSGALHLRADEHRQFAHYARGDVRRGVVRGLGVVQLAQPIDVFGSQYAVHSGRLPCVLAQVTPLFLRGELTV